MLLFGHAGVTLGAATVLANLPLVQARNSAGKQLNAKRARENARSPLDRVVKLVDIRLLLIGSLLPDIIDKPLMFAVPGLGGGHGLAHSLLFLALISFIGLFLFIRLRQTWMLALSFGTAVHLPLDQIWQCLHALLWPFYPLDKGDVTNWLPDMIRGLFSNPAVYVSEITGFAVVAWLGYLVVRRKRIWAFARRGQIRSSLALAAD